MLYHNYARGIRFRFFKPYADIRRYRKTAKLLKRLGISLELVNTRLPECDREMKQRLSPLHAMRRMSTFAIGALINKGVECMDEGTVYVNVGVWYGHSFFAGLMANENYKCVGVDNFSQFEGPKQEFRKQFDALRSENHHFFEEDYQTYFGRIHADPIGMYFYDGDHTYEHQLRGLQLAEPFFSENCIIMVDDTNWSEPRQATQDFMSSSRYCYEVIFDQTTACNRHPTYWNGLTILRRR